MDKSTQSLNKDVILVGGGRIWKGETKKADSYIRELALSNKDSPISVLFFPTSSGDRQDYINAFNKTYTSLGCDVNIVQFFNRQYSDHEIADYVDSSDIIYLGGGSPQLFKQKMSELQIEDNFINLLKQYHGILVGVSAGAALIARKYIDIYTKAFKYEDGWGIIPQTVIPHYKNIKNLPSKGKNTIYLSDYQLAHLSSKGLVVKSFAHDE